MEQFNIETLPLEKELAKLERTKQVLVTPSGMSAIHSVFQTYLSPGAEILINEDMYSGTLKLLRILYQDLGVKCVKVNMRDLEILQESITPKTKIIMLESPSNPMMNIIDIEKIVEISKSGNKEVIVLVDNTIMTSVLQSPLELGADIVVYSLTKYINGHQDVVMGAMATNDDEIAEKLKETRNQNGLLPSKFDCFMVERGLKTIGTRLQKHGANAILVADFLEKSPYIEKVFFGWETEGSEALRGRQMKGPNGMISFILKGDEEFSKNVLRNLKIITIGESYAGCESLICIP